MTSMYPHTSIRTAMRTSVRTSAHPSVHTSTRMATRVTIHMHARTSVLKSTHVSVHMFTLAPTRLVYPHVYGGNKLAVKKSYGQKQLWRTENSPPSPHHRFASTSSNNYTGRTIQAITT